MISFAFQALHIFFFFYVIQAGEEHAKTFGKQNAHPIKIVIKNTKSAIISKVLIFLLFWAKARSLKTSAIN